MKILVKAAVTGGTAFAVAGVALLGCALRRLPPFPGGGSGGGGGYFVVAGMGRQRFVTLQIGR